MAQVAPVVEDGVSGENSDFIKENLLMQKLSLNCEGEDPEAGSSSAVQESEPSEENKEMRVSKAQKRRDKKAEKGR